MIKVREKIIENDTERSQSLNYIESIEKEPLKPKSSKKGSYHPEDNTFTEDQ